MSAYMPAHMSAHISTRMYAHMQLWKSVSVSTCGVKPTAASMYERLMLDEMDVAVSGTRSRKSAVATSVRSMAPLRFAFANQ